MLFFKYQETDGIKVLTATKSYSKERFAEFNTRKWYSYAEMKQE